MSGHCNADEMSLLTHISHATLDKAVLLYAMIKKKKVDAGWIILNNMIDSVKPTKILWFRAIITQLCSKTIVEVEK